LQYDCSTPSCDIASDTVPWRQVMARELGASSSTSMHTRTALTDASTGLSADVFIVLLLLLQQTNNSLDFEKREERKNKWILMAKKNQM
jgi:hypothetical protein